MNHQKTKLHIERLTDRNTNERLLIASGAVFNFISSKILPISDVEIAMDLEISIPLVRRAIAALEQDELIVKNFEGDYVIPMRSGGDRLTAECGSG
jgi:DNA-binding transcriptional ArsR family regulator